VHTLSITWPVSTNAASKASFPARIPAGGGRGPRRFRYLTPTDPSILIKSGFGVGLGLPRLAGIWKNCRVLCRRLASPPAWAVALPAKQLQTHIARVRMHRSAVVFERKKHSVTPAGALFCLCRCTRWCSLGLSLLVRPSHWK
jgi:hypothetical protein